MAAVRLSIRYKADRIGSWRRKAMDDARPYRLVRERDLPAYAGLKRTQISELIKRGEFPRPIKLSDGGRAKAWLEDELLLWRRQRLAFAMPPGKTPTESEVPETTARATQHGPCPYSRRLPDCDSTDESILRSSMKGCRVQMSKNGSPTGTAPKKARRRPRWLGPLPEDPMYRRM